MVNICMERPICNTCNERPCAVNYKKEGVTYYRKKCNKCNGKRVKPFVPRWRQKGYKKKMTCDKCGYQARYGSQTVVFHMNGDLNDASLTNLRTVCLNCAVEVAKSDAPWKPGDILKDF
jgi:hypothetical protein